MSKPRIHAESSARRYGGKWEDYEEIHSFLDSSKSAIADNRHRTLTHNSWFISTVLERIKFSNSGPEINLRFPVIINSAGKQISVRDIAEQHVVEDFNGQFIPSAQDFLQELNYKDWMQNGHGEFPSSSAKIKERRAKKEQNKNPVDDGYVPRLTPTFPKYPAGPEITD